MSAYRYRSPLDKSKHIAQLPCSIIPVREYWIGLTDSASECYWAWTGSDAFLLFYDWVQYQPGTNTATNCAAMLEKNEYRWMDVSCTNLYRAICERS